MNVVFGNHCRSEHELFVEVREEFKTPLTYSPRRGLYRDDSSQPRAIVDDRDPV